MNVDSKHELYVEYSPVWARCRAAVAGARAVKKAKDTYLPRLSGHESNNDPRYLSYLQLAHYYNASGRTKDAFRGVVFAKEPEVQLPAAMEDFAKDVSLTGCDLESFADNIIGELLEVGRVGVLLDHTGDGEEKTRARAAALNERPKFVMYKTESIINWRFALVNKVWLPTLIVLHETTSEPAADDVFTTNTSDRYRVLQLVDGVYTVEVWGKNKDGFGILETYTPRKNGSTFDAIPFYFFSECGGDEIPQPPLMDLIDTNISHYVTSADYEHGCRYTAMPTYFGSGFRLEENESIPIGSATVYVRPEVEASLTITEFTGAGLSTLENNMGRKEKQMASLGARLLQDAPRQVETAQATNTKQNSENSVVAAIAKSVSKGVEGLLTLSAEWLAIAGDTTFRLNTDYIPDSVDATTVSALLGALQFGKISTATFLYNLQRGDYLPAGKTIEEEQADAEDDFVPPTLPPLEEGDEDDEDDEGGNA